MQDCLEDFACFFYPIRDALIARLQAGLCPFHWGIYVPLMDRMQAVETGMQAGVISFLRQEKVSAQTKDTCSLVAAAGGEAVLGEPCS
jgi:hypothetical protein